MYDYGINIRKQVMPINVGPVFGFSTLDFYPARYITEVNKILEGDLFLLPDQTYTVGRDIQAQLLTNMPANYSLYEDFSESPLV
jgi:hypothetical protein